MSEWVCKYHCTEMDEWMVTTTVYVWVGRSIPLTYMGGRVGQYQCMFTCGEGHGQLFTMIELDMDAHQKISKMFM